MEEKQMKSKVIGWNINQRSGMGKGIPQFVIDELIDQNADIIVLTELFQHSTIGYFWAEMERAGYQHAVTQNDGTNEVGILWKKDVYTFHAVDDSVITTMKNNHPNFLLVDLEDQNGQFLTVAETTKRSASFGSRTFYVSSITPRGRWRRWGRYRCKNRSPGKRQNRSRTGHRPG